MSDPQATHQAIGAIWRMEAPKVIATLTLTGEVAR